MGWAKLRNKVAQGVATYYGGPKAGEAVKKYQQGRANRSTVKTMPGGADSNVYDMETKDRLIMEDVGNVRGGLRIGTAGRPKSLRAAFAAAAALCRRYPVWCGTLTGGMPAVAQMMLNGQLPPPKRRRRRGISATDLSRFKRVAGFLRQWGNVCTGAPRAPRKRRC